MDPWLDNPKQEIRKDVLGFIGTPLAKGLVVIWCLIAILGLLWFWQHHKFITILSTSISVASGYAFLIIPQEEKNKKTLMLSFYGVVIAGIVSQLVQG